MPLIFKGYATNWGIFEEISKRQHNKHELDEYLKWMFSSNLKKSFMDSIENTQSILAEDKSLDLNSGTKSLISGVIEKKIEKDKKMANSMPHQIDTPIRYTRLTKQHPGDSFKQGIGQGKNVTKEGYSNYTHSRDNMSKSKYLSFIQELFLSPYSNWQQTNVTDPYEKDILAEILPLR